MSIDNKKGYIVLGAGRYLGSYTKYCVYAQVRLVVYPFTWSNLFALSVVGRQRALPMDRMPKIYNSNNLSLFRVD